MPDRLELPALAAVVRAHQEQLVQAATDRVAARHPVAGATRRNLEFGTRAAVEHFLRLLEAPEEPIDVALYHAHGRAQCAAGRSLRELLAFYRLSGEAMWESAAELPGAELLSGRQAMQLGGRVLRLIEELSVAAVDGFLEQGAELRRRDRARRDRLRSLLLAEPPASADALGQAAQAAGWTLPDRVRAAVTALAPDADEGDQERVPARVVSGPYRGERLVLFVADDEHAEGLVRRAAVALGVHGAIAVGPPAPVASAARSAARAAVLLDQLESGNLAVPVSGASDGEPSLVFCDEHDLALLLAAAPELGEALAERRLAPLQGLAPAKRAQVTETLQAWLADPGRPQAIADRLGMHVQSVRYRLTRLRELFGDALDDPEARFELQVALRTARVCPPAPAGEQTRSS